MSVTRLTELVVPGRRLGRHIDHDPRSLRFTLPGAASPVTVQWERRIPILDQGDVGACTGNATVGALGTGPLYDALAARLAAGLVLDERLALAIYSAAETIDGDGPYPPNDNGSSGLSVAKAAKADGYVAGYLHATSVAAVHTALAAGPVLIGSNWYSGMDDPNNDRGVVYATGAVRGGHEYLMRGYDATRDLFLLDNSWGASWGVAGSFHYDTPTLTKLLAESGDATSLVPATSPAPTPAPAPAGQVTRSWAAADLEILTGWAAQRHTGVNKSAADAFNRGR